VSINNEVRQDLMGGRAGYERLEARARGILSRQKGSSIPTIPTFQGRTRFVTEQRARRASEARVDNARVVHTQVVGCPAKVGKVGIAGNGGQERRRRRLT
jgi:hypothetical protein